ncbi:hypothetical protein [Kitasatospora sp. NPDC006786]|uniref:hypothetical protein n=1 Tax=unclassified Kitasatospora TaxID=2633591 RepID=UPI0033E52E87
MKYRTTTRRVQAVHPVTGTPITRTEEVRTPVLPRDWDRVALRAVVGLVLALTLAAITWSTYSIGELLAGGIGYAAAAIFDAAWVVCLLLEWMSRYEPDRRAFPRNLGWCLLVVTMLAIGTHGVREQDSYAAAIFGAGVSLFAKVLWLGVLAHIHRDLSPDDQALIEVERSRAHTTLALSSTRRQVARVEEAAALELLAMEQAGYAVPEAMPIAEVVPAGPAVPARPAPTRTEATLDRAVEAILSDTAGGDSEVGHEADRAIGAAHTDGWAIREIYDTARHRRREALEDLVSVYVAAGPRLRSGDLTPREVTEDARDLIDRAQRYGWSIEQIGEAVRAADPTAGRPSGRVQEASGHPDEPVSGQVAGGGVRGPVRTGFEAPERPEPEEQQRSERPAVRRMSLAAAVELLMVQAGITEREQLESMLPSMVGAPFRPESLDREMRKHR